LRICKSPSPFIATLFARSPIAHQQHYCYFCGASFSFKTTKPRQSLTGFSNETVCHSKQPTFRPSIYLCDHLAHTPSKHVRHPLIAPAGPLGRQHHHPRTYAQLTSLTIISNRHTTHSASYTVPLCRRKWRAAIPHKERHRPPPPVWTTVKRCLPRSTSLQTIVIGPQPNCTLAI
jgi:hypothetical protein